MAKNVIITISNVIINVIITNFLIRRMPDD